MRFEKIHRPMCPDRNDTEERAVKMKIKVTEKENKHIIKFFKRDELKHTIYFYSKTKKFFDPDFRDQDKGKFVKFCLSGWVMGYLTLDEKNIHPVKGKKGKWKEDIDGDYLPFKYRSRYVIHDKTDSYFAQLQVKYKDKKWINHPLMAVERKD